jgi:acetylornithine deacetylase/succinyl-diaminopimelate desuccinylase-like protein
MDDTPTPEVKAALIVIAEGDEERMSIGLRQFVKTHPELFKDAELLWNDGGQAPSGRSGISTGDSEGCVYIELTTSGTKWGRGPTVSDIHGGNKRSVDSPAWRHMQMLKTLVSEDGNRVMIPGFYDNIEPLSPTETAKLQAAAKNVDLKVAAENLGVARFIADDPLAFLKMARYGTSMNLDGIWGGNMYAGGAGAILPNKITSKHNFRYLPKQDGIDITKKLRAHLDQQGFADVEMKVIGDVPWAKMRYDTDIARALARTYDIFGIRYNQPADEPSILGPYWPAYLFAGSLSTSPSLEAQPVTVVEAMPRTSISSLKAPGGFMAWPAPKSPSQPSSTTSRDSMMLPLIQISDLTKTYVVGDLKVHALRQVSLQVKSG